MNNADKKQIPRRLNGRNCTIWNLNISVVVIPNSVTVALTT